MQRRLCGREQEFGLKIIAESRRWKFGENYRLDIIEKIIKAIPLIVPAVILEKDSYRCWLSNGALIYLDSDTLETATAEHLCGSLDGILQEKALEKILNQAVSLVMKGEIRGVKSVAFYKNNVWPEPDFIPNFAKEVPYGCHHNYSYLTRKRNLVLGTMRNFLPAALVFSGNGHVLRLDAKKFVYCLSQRASHILVFKRDTSTENRPLINLRDESLMDKASGLSRLHLISRDATRCEFQTWLVDGITHLVIRLAEEGWKLPKRLILDRPLLNFHRLNLSRGLQYQLQTVSKKVDAVDYLFLFLTAAQQLNPLSSEEKKILQEWERVLELLQAKAYDKLVGELDWVTKWYLLKNQMQREGYGLDDIRAWLLDMKYHNISPDPNQSVFAWLDEKGYIKHLVTEKAIQAAVYTPPETRAKSRGRFVEECFQDYWLRYSIRNFDWQQAETDERIIYFGEFKNPFSTKTFFKSAPPARLAV